MNSIENNNPLKAGNKNIKLALHVMMQPNIDPVRAKFYLIFTIVAIVILLAIIAVLNYV